MHDIRSLDTFTTTRGLIKIVSNTERHHAHAVLCQATGQPLSMDGERYHGSWWWGRSRMSC